MTINAEFVERYQLELARDPKSRVFAPLAEAYRKMGLHDEARRICKRGTEYHPDFAGGHVAFAKVLIDLKEHAEALPHLESAAKLSPDNILAHSLMGETLLQLRRPKDALKAFKMVLFLNPDDAKAQDAVRKWEFLTADEYDEKMFEMTPGFEAMPLGELNRAKTPEEELEDILEEVTAGGGRSSSKDTRLELAQRHARALDRAVSLADAFTIRNDLEAALKVVTDAIRLLGSHPELDRRAVLLERRLQILNDPEQEEFDGGDFATPEPDVRRAPQPVELEMQTGVLELDLSVDPQVERKREQLEALLRRISERRA
ncbi:MAG: tetratricopeptide repeat protein [Bdellovibrionota bacterium]